MCGEWVARTTRSVKNVASLVRRFVEVAIDLMDVEALSPPAATNNEGEEDQ